MSQYASCLRPINPSNISSIKGVSYMYIFWFRLDVSDVTMSRCTTSYSWALVKFPDISLPFFLEFFPYIINCLMVSIGWNTDAPKLNI